MGVCPWTVTGSKEQEPGKLALSRIAERFGDVLLQKAQKGVRPVSLKT
jgi:hypothetical protein